jgi:hypothetical protein
VIAGRIQTEDSDRTTDAYGASIGGKHELDMLTINYDDFRSTNDFNRERHLIYVVRNPGVSIWCDHTHRSQPVYTIANGKSPFDISAINRGDLTTNPYDASEAVTSAEVDVEKKFLLKRRVLTEGRRKIPRERPPPSSRAAALPHGHQPQRLSLRGHPETQHPHRVRHADEPRAGRPQGRGAAQELATIVHAAAAGVRARRSGRITGSESFPTSTART